MSQVSYQIGPDLSSRRGGRSTHTHTHTHTNANYTHVLIHSLTHTCIQQFLNYSMYFKNMQKQTDLLEDGGFDFFKASGYFTMHVSLITLIFFLFLFSFTSSFSLPSSLPLFLLPTSIYASINWLLTESTAGAGRQPRPHLVPHQAVSKGHQVQAVSGGECAYVRVHHMHTAMQPHFIVLCKMQVK